MAESESDYGNACIGAIHSDEPSIVPIPLASSDPNKRTEEICIQESDVQMILSADVSLTKQGEEGNETKRGAELLHGNDHEYNDMNSDMEVKCNQGEIFVTNTLIEKADSVVDSHTVSHLKHIDNISSAEEAPQEIISAATDLQSYSLQEYKFENSSQITRAWREFNKKEDICMKGCKW